MMSFIPPNMPRIQEEMVAMKMRERMAAVERRERGRNLKSDFHPPLPKLVIVIFLLIMLLTIVAFVVGYGLHLL